MPSASLDESLPDDEANRPDLAVQHRLTQECLTAALRHLTEEQRQVILLKFVENQSNAQVAALLGKPEGAVKSLQHRALAALRRALEKEYHDEP